MREELGNAMSDRILLIERHLRFKPDTGNVLHAGQRSCRVSE